MMISMTVGYIIAAIVGLLVFALIFWLFKKFKFKTATRFIWGAILGLIGATGVYMMNSRACIVKSKDDVSFYMVYGTPEYKMSDGKTVKIDAPLQNCMIINDTKEDLVLEAVIYGSSTTSKAKDELIPSMGHIVFKGMNINYVFDQMPPSSVKSKSGSEVKYWLRTYAAYEAEYGTGEDEEEMGDGDTTEEEVSGEEVAEEEAAPAE